jgi:ParB/RepB/Spo0J family partition protein
MATTKTSKSKKTTDELTLKAGGNYFLVDPATIKKGKQSRYFDHTKNDVMEKVRSFEEHGQLTPVTVRQLADKSLELFDGFCRLEAALEYNRLHTDSPMKLKVIVTGDNGENAFVKGLLNNHERKSTSVVDDAFAFKTLREEFGWKDKDIAAEFKTNPTKVSLCKKLTTLRRHILEMVHRKELAFDTAIALADFNDAQQDEILAKSEAYREQQKQTYEERMEAWMKDVKEIDVSVAPPEFDNGDAEGATEPPAPAKKPAPPESANAAAKRAIREKQAEAAARKAAGENTGNGNGGKPRGADIIPPTFAQLKQNVDAEFISIKDCPEPLYSLMTILMEYLNGKISQAKWAKDSKAESRKYEMKETPKK